MLCCGRPEEPVELTGGETVLVLSSWVDDSIAETTKKDTSWDALVTGVVDGVSTGAISVASTLAELPTNMAAGVKSSGEDLRNFFSSLKPKPSVQVSQPNMSAGSVASEATDATEDGTEAGDNPAAASALGVPMLDYQKYPLRSYVQLPAALDPFLDLPFLDHYLIVGLPTMAPSVGLAGHRAAVPKSDRAAAPFIIVVDEPGALAKYSGDRYVWVEFQLGDVFKLDVSGFKSMDDYAKTLSAKGRWNFKDRQKKFNNNKSIRSETVPIVPGDRAFVDTLWPLYKQTGEKNGFTVLTEEDFYKFHLTVEGLVVMMVTDVSDPAAPKLVSFCTGVRWRDVLMPMWCGTDYENPLNRTCSTYFNMLYNYVAAAIADPAIRWVDLGASRRTAKTAIGFKPYTSAGYFRCKNTVMQACVETMIQQYFHPERLINDP